MKKNFLINPLSPILVPHFVNIARGKYVITCNKYSEPVFSIFQNWNHNRTNLIVILLCCYKITYTR